MFSADPILDGYSSLREGEFRNKPVNREFQFPVLFPDNGNLVGERVRARLRPPPTSLGHSLSDQPLPKNIEFAGRNAANDVSVGTERLSGLPGLASSAWFFSAGGLASSLLLQAGNRRTSFARTKGNREFELNGRLPSIFPRCQIAHRPKDNY